MSVPRRSMGRRMTVTSSETHDSGDRISVLWRGAGSSKSAAANRRFDPLVKALADLGVTAESVLHADDAIPEMR